VRLKTVTDGGETVCHDKVGPDAHGFLCHDYDDIINRLTQMKIGGIGSDQHDTHSREDVTRMICVDNGDHCCACGGGHQEVAAPAADAGDELGSPTLFKSDECDPQACDNWTCKNWCKCFKAHPEIIEIFEGPNPSTAEQAIRNSCPSDNDECDCTKYHFGNAKKEVASSGDPSLWGDKCDMLAYDMMHGGDVDCESLRKELNVFLPHGGLFSMSYCQAPTPSNRVDYCVQMRAQAALGTPAADYCHANCDSQRLKSEIDALVSLLNSYSQ
jgi:hypothetical protein